MANEQQGERLDSWKEIAEYLGRDVRTVVRWEKDKGLPIRRLPGGKRQSVFAFTAEIDAWLLQQEQAPEIITSFPGVSADPTPPADESGPPLKESASTVRRVVWQAAAFVVIVLLGLSVVLWKRKSAELPASAELSRTISFNTPTGPIRFVRSEIETGVQAYQFVAADLNGDGKLDLVFVSTTGDMVGVLLGKGDGSFQPAQLHGGCREPSNLVLADFNRDGHPDIAVACNAGNTVTILRGAGDGTFPERTEIPIPGGPRFIASGDLNADGWPDLAVSTYNEPALFVLINRDGRFTPKLLSRFEGTANLAVGDLNRDGHADLIACIRVQGKYGFALFWGKGDGSFRPGDNILAWDEASRMAFGFIALVDLTGDGLMDIVFSLWSRNVMIAPGLGGGEFGKPVPLPGTETSGGPRTFGLGDLNLDGKLDVLVADNREARLLLYFGVGAGKFTSGSAAPFEKGLFFYPISYPSVADFNGDGLPDIVVNNYYEKRLVLLLADWKKTTP